MTSYVSDPTASFLRSRSERLSSSQPRSQPSHPTYQVVFEQLPYLIDRSGQHNRGDYQVAVTYRRKALNFSATWGVVSLSRSVNLIDPICDAGWRPMVRPMKATPKRQEGVENKAARQPKPKGATRQPWPTTILYYLRTGISCTRSTAYLVFCACNH